MKSEKNKALLYLTSLVVDRNVILTESVVYDHALSEKDIQKIQKRLSIKHGIPIQ